MNSNESSRLYSIEHENKERALYNSSPRRGKNSEYFFSWNKTNLLSLENIIKVTNPLSILDYGCGHGYATEKLVQKFPHINFYNYDPFVEKYSTYPTIPCDLIISNNTMHVIETEFYGQVLENLYNLSLKNVLIKLYVYEELRSLDWYINQFSKFFTINDVTLSSALPADIGVIESNITKKNKTKNSSIFSFTKIIIKQL
jgi:hypothetical protein